MLARYFPQLHYILLNIISWGDFAQIQKELALRWVHPHETILTLPILSGEQAFLNAQRAATTVCISSAPSLMRRLMQTIYTSHLSSFIYVVNIRFASVASAFKRGSFDSVQLFLCYDYVHREILKLLIHESSRMLKSDGTLMLVAKTKPAHILQKLFYWMIDFPFSLILFFFTGIRIPTTSHLSVLIEEGGFEIYEKRFFYVGIFEVLICQKKSG